MRLVILIALLLVSAEALANNAGQVLQAVGAVMQFIPGWNIVGMVLMTIGGVYGAQQAQKAAAEAARQAQDAARQSFNNALQDRTITSVSTDSPYVYVYGRARVGSTIVAMFTSGDKDQYKHLVCIHAAHECDAIEEVYISGTALGTLDGNGDVTGGLYSVTNTYSNTSGSLGDYAEPFTGTTYTLAQATAIANSVRVLQWSATGGMVGQGGLVNVPFTLASGVVTVDAAVAAAGTCYAVYDYTVVTSRVRVTKHLGAPGQAADAALMALNVGWQASSTLTGMCYTVIRLDLNQPEFQGGIPSIEVLVRGKKLYDPRSGITAWSQNPALAVYDYLTSDMCGVPGSQQLLTGTAQTSAQQSLTLAANANTSADYYAGAVISIVSGSGAGQSRTVISSRYFLALYSQEFDNAYWTKSGILPFGSGSVGNAIAAPDGTITADLIVEDTTPAATHALVVANAFTPQVGLQYTVRWRIKSYSANRKFRINLSGSSGQWGVGSTTAAAATFDPDAGVVTGISATAASASMTPDTNVAGWYICSLTTVACVAANASSINGSLYNGATSYNGDGVSGLYVWGFNLYSGTDSLGYVRTTANAAVGAVLDTAWSSNVQIFSEDWTNATYSKTATVTANTVADTSFSDRQSVYDLFAIAVSGVPFCTSVHVLKDTIGRATRYCALRLQIPDSAAAYATVKLDTSTGEIALDTTIGTFVLDGYGVIDAGSEWRIWLAGRQNGVVGGAVVHTLFPAYGAGATWGGGVTATGMVTASKIQLEVGTTPSPYAATGATPIALPGATSVYNVNSGAGDIPIADYITAANVCDELITIGNLVNAPRYVINGTVTADQDQAKVLDALAQCMAGGIVGTTWSCWAGKYIAPVKALDQSDIIGPLSVVSGTPDADLYNGIKGQYIGAENLYVVTDYTPYQNGTYVASDGGEQWGSIDFLFTDTCQRIWNLSRIYLEDQRNGFTVRATFSLKCWPLRIGDRVTLTSTFLGQTNKVYRITDKKFGQDMGVELALKEDDPSIWDLVDAATVDSTPNTNLPNPNVLPPPGNLRVSESLYATTGSTGVRTLATLMWDAPANSTITGYEVDYKPYNTGIWQVMSDVRNNSIGLSDLAPTTYDFRVRATNILGVLSPYTDIYTAMIYGLTAPPSNVTGFSVAVMNGMAFASWDKAPDLDVRLGGKVDIRLCPLTTGATWEQSILLQEFTGDTSSGVVPLYTGTYYIKFVDSTGHYSDTPATFVATEAIVSGWTTVASSVQDPSFAGTCNNTVANGGILSLLGVTLFDSLPMIDSVSGLMDSLGGIVPSGTYAFDATLDLGTVASRRFFVNMRSLAYDTGDLIDQRLGLIDKWSTIDGAVINDCDVTVLAKVSNDNITFGPWTPFMIADFNCRYAKFKAQLTSATSTHNIAVSTLSVTVKTSP